MKKCDRSEDLLARFVHGEVLLQEKEELERHLTDCASCKALYWGITEVDRTLREMPGKLVDPPPHLRAKILLSLPDPAASRRASVWGRWAAVGGAFACALLALILLLRFGGHRESRVASLSSHQSAGRAAPVQPKEDGNSAGPIATAVRPVPAKPLPAPAPGAPVASAPRVQVVREVRIYFYCPPARSVAVTGDFNGWDPDGVPLKAAGKPGLWEATLQLNPGAYSYNFIVDGNVLVPDPDSANQMPDGYGGTNSILLVKNGNSV